MLNTTKSFSSFAVDKLKKAKHFYGEILELKVVENDMGLLELHTEDNNPIIIYPKPNHIPATFTIHNFQVDDIEETVDRLIEKGVVFLQYEAPIKTDEKGICRGNEGPNIAWFTDPAGNILSVIEASR